MTGKAFHVESLAQFGVRVSCYFEHLSSRALRCRFSGYCEEGTDRADCGLPPLDPHLNCPALGADPFEPAAGARPATHASWND